MNIHLKMRGFTLIEVLIALVVLAVGMVAVIQFQNTLLNTATESEKRALAVDVAEKVIEEARGFQKISELDTLVLPTNASAQFGTSSIDFTIEPVMVYLDSDLNVVTSLSQASFSELIVTVYPQSGSTAETTVELSTLIGKIHPGEESLPTGDGAGGVTPNIDYSKGASPDVIAIEVKSDETQRETSKPLPELERSGQNYQSTSVKFETVTYRDANNDGDSRITTEDFVTTNCLCEITARGLGLPPATTVLNAGSEEYTVEYSTSKEEKARGAVPSDESGQSFLCDRCCRDHHDSAGEANIDNYKWYWPTSVAAGSLFWDESSAEFLRGDHKHFLLTGTPDSPSSVVANSIGAKYNENCRFKRVDGEYRLMQDWRLADLTIFPRDYFTMDTATVSGAQNIEKYRTYVASFARESVSEALASSTLLGESDITLGDKSMIFSGRDLVSGALGSISKNDTRQLISRSIYFDPLTSAAVQIIQDKIAADEDWLYLAPFYEVNTTLLATWDASVPAIGSISNEPLSEIFDPDNQYYGSYSRGLVTGIASGAASVSASSFDTNTGLVGHFGRDAQGNSYVERVLWSDDLIDSNPNYEKTDYIQIEVTEDQNYISGTFECAKVGNNGEANCNFNARNSTDYDDFVAAIGALTISSSYGGSCSASIETVSYLWRCNYASEPGTDLITFEVNAASDTLFYSTAASGNADYAGKYNPITVSTDQSGEKVIIVLP